MTAEAITFRLITHRPLLHRLSSPKMGPGGGGGGRPGRGAAADPSPAAAAAAAAHIRPEGAGGGEGRGAVSRAEPCRSTETGATNTAQSGRLARAACGATRTRGEGGGGGGQQRAPPPPAGAGPGPRSGDSAPFLPANGSELGSALPARPPPSSNPIETVRSREEPPALAESPCSPRASGTTAPAQT